MEIKTVKTETSKDAIISFFKIKMGMPNVNSAKSGIEGFLEMIGNDQIDTEQMRAVIKSSNPEIKIKN